MGVKSKLSTMLNTTPAPFANALPYVTLPYVLLTFDTQSVLDSKYRSAPSFSTQRSTPSPVIPNRPLLSFRAPPFCHSEHSEESKLTAHPPSTDLSFPASLEITQAKFCHSQRSIPSLPSRTQHPFPVILSAAKNLNSSHTHRSQTSHSSPHSKRHGPNSAIPNTASLPPVILNAAQRSEESKLLAHPPFTDLTFLPSLETTRPKFCHPEHSIPSLPSRTQPPPSCHLEHSIPSLPSRTQPPPPVILNAAQQFTLSF